MWDLRFILSATMIVANEKSASDEHQLQLCKGDLCVESRLPPASAACGGTHRYSTLDMRYSFDNSSGSPKLNSSLKESSILFEVPKRSQSITSDSIQP